MTFTPTRPLLGLIIVLIGTAFLLDVLGWFNVSSLVGFAFPLLIIAIGVLSYLSNPKAFILPVGLVLFGLLLLLNAVGLIAVNVWRLVIPIAIIGFGLSLVIRRPEGSVREDTSDTVEATVIFSGLDINNTSHNFQGGAVTAAFGGAEIDLRHSVLPSSATIDVFVAFGGITLKVPEGWNVHFSGLPVFGGMEDRSAKPETADAPTLYVKGTCLFGGVEIKN